MLVCLVATLSCRGERSEATEDSGTLIEVAAAPDTLVTTVSALLAGVSDMHVAEDGRLYISDEREHNVKVLNAEGIHVQTIGQQGEGPGEFSRPVSLAIRADSLLVLDPGNSRLQVFSLDGDVLSTRSVSGMYNPVVGTHGGLAHATLGADSILAIMLSADGDERARIGDVLAPPTNIVNLQEMRRQIEAGEVPGIFLNTAIPVIDEDEAVWLILPSAGRVDRFDREGNPLFSVTLSEPEFEAAWEEFVSRNAEAAANRAFHLEYLRNAEAVGTDLWILLGGSDEEGATVLALSSDGDIEQKLRFGGVRGAGDLAVDAERGLVYFYIRDTTELLRVALDAGLPD